MAKNVLLSVSLERVENRLAHDLKHSVTKNHRTLHADALNDVKALRAELTAFAVPLVELEREYAELDASYQRVRERRVKAFGKGSALVIALDASHKLGVGSRFRPREVATAIASQMDVALKNYLDGGVTLAELRTAAELGLGAFPSAAPFTVALQILQTLDKSIDRLGALRDASEQYSLRVELFGLVARGFTELFRTLRERTEAELRSLY